MIGLFSFVETPTHFRLIIITFSRSDHKLGKIADGTRLFTKSLLIQTDKDFHCDRWNVLFPFSKRNNPQTNYQIIKKVSDCIREQDQFQAFPKVLEQALVPSFILEQVHPRAGYKIKKNSWLPEGNHELKLRLTERKFGCPKNDFHEAIKVHCRAL